MHNQLRIHLPTPTPTIIKQEKESTSTRESSADSSWTTCSSQSPFITHYPPPPSFPSLPYSSLGGAKLMGGDEERYLELPMPFVHRRGPYGAHKT